MKNEPNHLRSKLLIVPALSFLLLLTSGYGWAQEKSSTDPAQQKSSYQQQDEQKKQQSNQDSQSAKQSDSKTASQPATGNNQPMDRNQAKQEKTTERTEITAVILPGQKPDDNLVNYRTFVGREVRSAGGKDIGEVDNVVVSEDGSQIRAVLDVGGFLGIGDKKVLVSMDELQFDPTADYVVYQGTEKELESHMAYKEPDENTWTDRGYAGRSYGRSYRSGYDRGYYGGSRGRGYGPGYAFSDMDRRHHTQDRWTSPGYDRYDDDRYGRGFSSDQQHYGRGYYEDRQGERYPYRGGNYDRENDGRYRQWDPSSDNPYGPPSMGRYDNYNDRRSD